MQVRVISTEFSTILLEVSYATPLMLLGHGMVEVTPASTGSQHEILKCNIAIIYWLIWVVQGQRGDTEAQMD